MACLRDVRGGFWLALSVPASALSSFVCDRPWIFVVIVVVAIPLLDALIGRTERVGGAPLAEASAVIPDMFICMWGMTLLVAVARASTAHLENWVGLALGTGALSAFAMAHAHEAMHRHSRVSRAFADVTFVLAGYPHYQLAHRVHHAHVGDARFGSTAPAGVSVWRHVAPSFISALRCATAVEQQRASHVLQNRVITLSIAWGGALAAFSVYSGWKSGALFVTQSVVSDFVVEVIGYIQHYGLSTEASAEHVAWEVDYWLSNRLLANNGLHEHHHLAAMTPYNQLRARGESLPGGYLHMFCLALIPPMWFAMMGPKLATKRPIVQKHLVDKTK